MRKTLLIAGSILLVALAATAQEMRPIGYLAEFQVNAGKEAEFIELVKKYDKPLFDGLVTEGAVLAWGLDARVVHEEGTATHMLWWATADFAGMDKVFAAFEAMEVPDEDEEKFRQTVDLAKHHDHITRSIIINVSEGEPSAPPYTAWSFIKVKRGKGSEWRKLFEKYTQPVLDKLMEDGILYGYGVDVEWIHTDDPGWRAIWVLTTSLSAFDKLEAAFRAASQGRSEEEREAIDRKFRKITEGGSHRDSLWRSIPLDGDE
jgi:hypothetical protein